VNEPTIAASIADLHERLDNVEVKLSPRFWFYGPNRFYGIRHNVLPWLGSDGNETWCRRTLVLPLFGLGAIIVGLKWHLLEDCLKSAIEDAS
jgi:hypothetical protein